VPRFLIAICQEKNGASSCTEAKHERKEESGNERDTKGRRRRRKEKLSHEK